MSDSEPEEEVPQGLPSRYVHKNHNISVLLYHMVCPTKYRRAVVDEMGDVVLRDIRLSIADRYEIVFLEISTDRNHVYFLIQSVPAYRPTQIARTINSLSTREISRRVPVVKKALWGPLLESVRPISTLKVL